MQQFVEHHNKCSVYLPFVNLLDRAFIGGGIVISADPAYSAAPLLSFIKRTALAAVNLLSQRVGVLAFELLGVMNGNYDNTANAIGSILGGIGEGVKLTFYGDDVINPFTGEVVYHEDGLWQTGVANIASAIQDLFDKGELQEVDGKVKLTYDQFKEIYNQLWEIAPKPGVNFESNYSSFFIDFDGMPYEYPIGALPTVSYYVEEYPGESYAACYYNDDQIVFSDYYITLRYNVPKGDFAFSCDYLNSNFAGSNVGGFAAGGGVRVLYENPENCFTFESLSSASIQYQSAGNNIRTHSTSNCFVFSNGVLTYTPISEVDLTGCKFGLVSTSGDYSGFLKSLNGYVSIKGAEDLDDLSGILPTEYNSSLSFPVNPDLSRPLDNQIIVGDVPGVSDLPLSDYKENLKTDIEVPSIIASKFPFCIPFDFMRFLGLLCSDPVAPVFRIPISTNPDNLDQWIGNQTVGEYLSPSEPMFEIDEEIVIDLSVIPLVQPVCYTCFIVGFIIMLLHITPKMIQH